MATLTPLASLLVGGAALTEHDDLPTGEGRIGQPVWSQGQLIGDLELRLGLPTPQANEAVRVQRWSRRLEEVHAERPRFFSESYRVDPMGTATALLVMRDELVLAGWNGEKIPGGSERLDTFAELEVGPALPLGTTR